MANVRLHAGTSCLVLRSAALLAPGPRRVGEIHLGLVRARLLGYATVAWILRRRAPRRRSEDATNLVQDSNVRVRMCVADLRQARNLDRSFRTKC